MAGPLNMSNNKSAHLANPTADKDAVSRVYGDGRYVKKGEDTMTGNLALGDNYITGLNSKQTDYDTNQPNLRQEVIDWKNAKYSFFNNVISYWNSLPSKVVEAGSLDLFKCKLKSILKL